uniref:18 kDa Sin3-associated polypeptide n=1 Tax=Lynceus sp. MCZ IZ 141354 TaxID=1930659 RepID=A0A9N6ZFV0_9CRUS|nr:EOG090X0HU3 [Lynceus sp. MCZ IZ 141354]
MDRIESQVEERKHEPQKPIDREKTCPLLLRVFYSTGRHHNVSDFARGSVPSNELQIYTWMDATLLELTSLIREVNPDSRRRGTTFEFSVVFPDFRSTSYRINHWGTTTSGEKGPDDSKSLQQLRFSIGDYVSVAILPPRNRRPRNY